MKRNIWLFVLAAVVIMLFAWGCSEKSTDPDPGNGDNGDIVITSIDPASGVEDDIVAIDGTGFGDTEAQVLFNDVVTYIWLWSDTLIWCDVPAGLSEGTVVVKVVVDGTESNGVNFTIGGATSVHITSITPTSGMEDTFVVVLGTGFGVGYMEDEVMFGDVAAIYYYYWSDTEIWCDVPPGLSEGALIVTVLVDGIESNGVGFTITGGATSVHITSIDPPNHREGGWVKIIGTGFGTGGEIWFGDFRSTGAGIGWSDTLLSCRVPDSLPLSIPVLVKVVAEGTESNGVEFTRDLTGYNRAQTWLNCHSCFRNEAGETWDSNGHYGTGSSGRCVWGSFTGYTFYGYLQELSPSQIDSYTVIATIDPITLVVTSLEYTWYRRYSSGLIPYYQHFTASNIPHQPEPGDTWYNAFEFSTVGAEVCSCLDTLDYYGDGWGMTSYDCGEGSSLGIRFTVY